MRGRLGGAGVLMKKVSAASAAPVSVRFLNSSAADPDGNDEGPEAGGSAPEQASGDSGQSCGSTPDSASSPPVAPPRRHHVRSRADEWRDALHDLSPVKELVSRLGKSRSSSVDVPLSLEKVAEARSVPEGDTWARLSELRGKITKTVEDKISDYRSGSGRPTAAAAPADSEPLLSEADVLESVCDSPPSSPSRSPSPPPADCPDVAFVNVPSPVAAEPAEPAEPTVAAPSPSRRDFRLASIRPKIYERLQRHVGRPPTSAPPPPPPPSPPDSVTLSALKDKYIDEEAVEEAVEAAEEILEPAPVPAEGEAPRQPQPPAVEAREAAVDSERAGWSAGRVSVLPRLSVGHWAVLLAALILAAPLPPFVSGLLLGALLTALAASALFQLVSPRYRGPAVTSLSHLPPAIHEEEPALMHKGWMHELLAGPYAPDRHQPTQARFVRLEGSMLRISHPKGYVSRRAQCNENLPSLPFVQQRIYDVAGCQVELAPPGLHHTRQWNRRYPVCIRLDNCRRVTRSMALESGPLRPTAARGHTSDGGSEAEEEAVGLDGAAPPEAEQTLTLFARTDRGKQEWFRQLQQASAVAEPPAAAAAAAADPEPESDVSTNMAAPVQLTPKLDFDYYMSKLMTATPQDNCDSRPSSPADAPPTTGHVMWFNALVGRLAFDVFGSQKWADLVQSRVQRKLSKLKLPFFIEELVVTSCDLGSAAPRIVSVAAPRSDQRGLWLDMSVLYEGGACMTLRTKVNLMKLGKMERDRERDRNDSTLSPPSDSGGPQDQSAPSETSSLAAERSPSCATYQFDRDDEVASVDSSSDEDDQDGPPPVNSDSGSTTSATPGAAASQPGPSVGKRFLQVVDRVTTSRYFQQAAQNRYVKRYIEEFSNTPLELAVTLKHLRAVLTVNIPRPPTDRVWYGFRGQPDILLSALPRLGTRDVTLTQVTDWIENKLVEEVNKMLVLPNMDDVIIPLLNEELPTEQAGQPT